MTLPLWVVAWLGAEGIATRQFLSFLEVLASKVSAPPEKVAAIVEWVAKNVTAQLDPERVLAFATLVVAELKSGHPGYNADAGGLT